MAAEVFRFPDPDQRDPDACAVQRDPARAAVIIILPVVRAESAGWRAQLERRGKKRTIKMTAKIARLLLALAFFLALAALHTVARAQVTVPGLPMTPLGYCQLTSIDSSTLISSCSGGIPAGATMAYVQPEAQAVRWRDDGTAPSATVGMPLAVGSALLYVGTLPALRVISQTAGAKLNVTFYK
jgi:hypothetical protein